MVFAPTSEAAQACASPIRNVLWGAHKVAVLLPQGEEPIKVPELPFSLPLCARQPSPLCISASFVPASLPLCSFQPAPGAFQRFPSQAWQGPKLVTSRTSTHQYPFMRSFCNPLQGLPATLL